MTSISLLDFAVRFACGLTLGLPLLRRGDVPPGFHRVVWLVILGLLSVALMSAANAGGAGALGVALGGFLLTAIAASILWGLDSRVLGSRVEAFALVLAAAMLFLLPHAGEDRPGFLSLASRFSSSYLMGVTALAMLLGHRYLTAPSMSLDSLRGLLLGAMAGIIIRAMLALVGVIAVGEAIAGGSHDAAFWAVILLMRWGLGIVVPSVGIWMAWGAARIGSTQSATGILYVMVAFTIVGELSATYLSGRTGVPA